LIFSNVRSGAEATTYWLRENFPEIADQIECHHGSLERDVRREVEDRLKRGELRAVVCSTSLELGIDIGAVELVVMLSTPKGVSKALQRAGRAGHNIHAISRGLLMATNVSDLVEASATVLLARSRHLETGAHSAIAARRARAAPRLDGLHCLLDASGSAGADPPRLPFCRARGGGIR
jgi:ATP-dependent Lhr-like helicase